MSRSSCPPSPTTATSGPQPQPRARASAASPDGWRLQGLQSRSAVLLSSMSVPGPTSCSSQLPRFLPLPQKSECRRGVRVGTPQGPGHLEAAPPRLWWRHLLAMLGPTTCQAHFPARNSHWPISVGVTGLGPADPLWPVVFPLGHQKLPGAGSGCGDPQVGLAGPWGGKEGLVWGEPA